MGQVGAGLKALIVDDEEVVRSLLEDLLDEFGFAVTECDSVGEARTLLAESEFDLALLDKNLPDGTGLDLARELSERDCAVVLVSGFANLSSAVEAIQAGVADYIIKPFDVADLEARLEKVIEVLKLRRSNRTLVAELEAKNVMLEKVAATDPLTGLYNFNFFRHRLHEEVERARRNDQPFSLAYLDIVGFSELNESKGHSAGDEVLRRMATLLKSHLRGQDVVARLSADKFALVLPATAERGAAVLANKLQELTTAEALGHDLKLAIGIAEFPDHGKDTADLLSAVDLAIATAKSDAVPMVTYRAEMSDARSQAKSAKEKLARQLRALTTSIEERQFRMVYQPIVESAEKIFAYEALVRPSNDAFAHPGELFGTAERGGQIVALDRVLREMTVEPLGDLGAEQLMFINLHPLDLFDSRLLSGEEKHLIRHAERIVLEVTEVAEIENFDRARENLDVLRNLGFRIAVDDLGAGYSGLNNLALLNPDFVKLDMALVRGVDKNRRMASLIRHIIDFANCEGMRVIAEGVETKGEYATVHELGAHLYQGYYFARPSPPFCEITISPE